MRQAQHLEQQAKDARCLECYALPNNVVLSL
jgi:hypothetical protein